MKPSPIRDLARRYAAGELSLDEYRAQRRDLINEFATGERRLEYGELSRRTRRPYLRWLIAVPLVLLVTAGVVTLLWVEHSRVHYKHGAQTGVPLETGPALVRAFMQTNDWSDAGLDRFLQHWQILPTREQKAAHDSYLFPRLVSQLQQQINSQRAMVDLAPGSNSASLHLTRLQQMAAVLEVQQQD